MEKAESYSAHALAEAVNRWCAERGVIPLNGQIAPLITERIIRYYCAEGLIDPPGAGSGRTRRGFTEKHAAQLRIVRVLQARHYLLEQIRHYLRGRTPQDLKDLEQAELLRLQSEATAVVASEGKEIWALTALGGEFLLVSRRSGTISDAQRRQIADVLGVKPPKN